MRLALAGRIFFGGWEGFGLMGVWGKLFGSRMDVGWGLVGDVRVFAELAISFSKWGGCREVMEQPDGGVKL